MTPTCGPTVRVAAGWIGEVDTVVVYMGNHSKFGPVGSETPVTAKTRLCASTAVDAHSELYVLSQLGSYHSIPLTEHHKHDQWR